MFIDPIAEAFHKRVGDRAVREVRGVRQESGALKLRLTLPPILVLSRLVLVVWLRLPRAIMA